MASPIFDKEQYELRNHLPVPMTEGQKTALNLAISRVNGQLDWNAQLLGFNGTNYWGKRIPTTDGSYKWNGLPQTVSEKRAVQTGAFGVYAKDKSYSDRPAPFNREEVRASADQTFDIFEKDGRTLVVPYGQPRDLLYDKTPRLIAGAEYTFNELVDVETNTEATEWLYVTQDLDQGITAIRLLGDLEDSPALFIKLQDSLAEPCIFFLESWKDISDWTTSDILTQFIGVWGNKGNAIASHFLFDALDVHGFNEEESLTLDTVNETITINDLLELVGLVPGPATAIITSHYNFTTSSCEDVYRPSIDLDTRIIRIETEDGKVLETVNDFEISINDSGCDSQDNCYAAPIPEFGQCENPNFTLTLRQSYETDATGIAVDPGPGVSSAIGCNGIPIGDLSGIDGDDIVVDVAGEVGPILMSDPETNDEIELVVSGGEYDGFVLGFDGLELSAISFEYEAKNTFGQTRFPCVEWIFDPTLDNSTYAPIMPEAAWMGTDDGEYDRQRTPVPLARQSDVPCVGSLSFVGGFLSFDDGIFDEIVSPNCDLLDEPFDKCSVVDGGFYEIGINPLAPPNSSTICTDECGNVDSGLYIYGEIPTGDAAIDGGTLGVCVIYDNTEYDIYQVIESECISYNNGVYSNTNPVIACVITDKSTFSSGSYDERLIDDGILRNSEIIEVIGVATESSLILEIESGDELGIDPAIIIPPTDPVTCKPCSNDTPEPIVVDCELNNGDFDNNLPPTQTTDDGAYDQVLDPSCVPCTQGNADVIPCPVELLRVRLDEIIFSAPRWRMRPSVMNSLTPLRVWKDRVLNVADPDSDNAFINPLVADLNSGPENPDSYRHFARLPLEYARNGKSWNRAESILANQSYFSRLLPPVSTQLPVIDEKPLLYDETYFVQNQLIPDDATFYVEDYLVSTIRADDDVLEDGFTPASESYEAVPRTLPFVSSTTVGYDAYSFRFLNADGTRVGQYLKWGLREKNLTGYLTEDVDSYTLRYTTIAEPIVSDASETLIPNIEFPDDPDRASFSNYSVCYAYFVADMSAGDDPVFDPTNWTNHRSKRVCESAIDAELITTENGLILITEDYEPISTGSPTELIQISLSTQSRYIFHDDSVPACPEPELVR